VLSHRKFAHGGEQVLSYGFSRQCPAQQLYKMDRVAAGAVANLLPTAGTAGHNGTFEGEIPHCRQQ
jgi:hypothetical protein